MTWLGKQPDTIFLGQSIAYPGNAIFKTLSGVPMDKRLELPVSKGIPTPGKREVGDFLVKEA